MCVSYSAVHNGTDVSSEEDVRTGQGSEPVLNEST